MKKIMLLALAITFLLTLLSYYIPMNNKLAINFLYSENQQTVHIDFLNMRGDFENILNHIESFSKEHEISIVHYTLFDEIDLNIYVANFPKNDRMHLIRGRLPENNEHLSNQSYEASNPYQAGQISFPFSNWNLRVFNMEQVRNVGFSRNFHLINASEEVAEIFMEEFSIYGETSLGDDWQVNWLKEAFVFQNIYGHSANQFSLFTSPIDNALFFSYLILFLTVILFLLKEKQCFLLQNLWGYPKFFLYYSIPKMLLPLFSLIAALFFLVLLIIITVFDQHGFFPLYMRYFFLSLIYVGVAFTLLLIIGIFLTKNISQLSASLKGKSFFERLQWLSFTVKVILLTFVLLTLNNFLNVIGYLRQEMNELRYWQQAENIYHVLGFNQPIDIDYNDSLSTEEFFALLEEWGEDIQARLQIIEESGMTIDAYVAQYLFVTDPLQMREEDDRLHEFFLRAEAEHEAFFFDGRDFWGYTSEEPTFFYEYLMEGNPFEAFQATFRRITISKNYLNQNPIFDIFGINVLESLINDDRTLNILIPEFYSHLKDELVQHYLNEFYWDRIVFINSTRELLEEELLDITKDDLSVNVIFTQPHQSYFTFSRFFGNEQNIIIDPIAVIFNPYIFSGQTTSLISRAFFFKDVSRGQAIDTLTPLITELGVARISHVQSVFSMGNQNLIRLQWIAFQQTLNVIMNIGFTLFLCIIMIWSHYQQQSYKINLKYLFGYSYKERNREIIILTLTANLIGAFIYFLFIGTYFQLIFPLLAITLIDLLMINILGNQLTKKSVVKILKGGEL